MRSDLVEILARLIAEIGVPECPSGRPVRIRPDWVCEILSPSNEKRDLVDKMRTLHASAVPHYWVLNTEEKVLVVHRHSAAGYVVVLTASSVRPSELNRSKTSSSASVCFSATKTTTTKAALDS